MCVTGYLEKKKLFLLKIFFFIASKFFNNSNFNGIYKNASYWFIDCECYKCFSFAILLIIWTWLIACEILLIFKNVSFNFKKKYF